MTQQTNYSAQAKAVDSALRKYHIHTTSPMSSQERLRSDSNKRYIGCFLRIISHFNDKNAFESNLFAVAGWIVIPAFFAVYRTFTAF